MKQISYRIVFASVLHGWVVGTLFCIGPVWGATTESALFRERIAPIFQRHCLRCHHDGDPSGGLSLSSRGSLLDSGYLIPGDVANSHLLEVVASNEGARPLMPKTGQPLSAAEVKQLGHWIESGAAWPSDVTLVDTSGKAWWALKPPQRPEQLPSADGDSNNPIDRFVAARRAPRQLLPSPIASRRQRIRRLYLLALGVPPSLKEQTKFLSDTQPGAWQRLVDRTLSDPRFGERWAQHWLDLVRWAETAGFETNAPRQRAWPYRDWVISALNDDKPYDQFLFEQLAGDTVAADAALGFLVAGPANLPGQIGEDEASIRQARQDELDEVIRAVSQTFMGLTIGCARCHDHKFDPITQRDYYAMQDIFAGLHYGTRRLRGPTNERWQSRLPRLEARIERLRHQWEALRQKLGLLPAMNDVQQHTFEPLIARKIRMTIHATADGSPASLFEFQVWSMPDGDAKSVNVAHASQAAVASASSFALENQTRHPDNLIDGYLDDAGPGWPWKSKTHGSAWLQIQLHRATPIQKIVWYRGHGGPPVDFRIDALDESGQWVPLVDSRRYHLRLDDRRTADAVRLDGVPQSEIDSVVKLRDRLKNALSEQARLRSGPQVFAARFSQPQRTWLLERGDPMQRIEPVTANVPSILGELDDGAWTCESDRRVALARHLTQPDHPLTSRVIVNRIWQHYFGRGLVGTPSDFGQMGTSPTHPQLLDWLAVELVEKDWSLKTIHRLILNSQTFQQSSQPRAKALAIDAGSRWLWRFPPRRMEAESIRDSILTVSGQLNRTRYGVGFDFFDQRGGLSDYTSKSTFDANGWRRMIYARKIRMQAIDIFSAFDCPDAGQLTPKRNRSNTPIQALSLLNSPFVNRQADYFASRLAAAITAPQKQQVSSFDNQITRAFELALTRRPLPEELQRLRQLAAEHGMPAVCRVLFNTSEFITVP